MKNSKKIILSSVLFCSFSLSQLAHAVDAPVLAKRLSFSWDANADWDSCRNFTWDDGTYWDIELDEASASYSDGFFGASSEGSSSEVYEMYPGSIAMWDWNNGSAFCWAGYLALQNNSLHLTYDDWSGSIFNDISKVRLRNNTFTGAYSYLGATNMNQHGNDNDNWFVTFVNRSQTPLTLHYKYESKWTSPAAPNDYTVPACSTYRMPIGTYLYDYDASANAYTAWPNFTGGITYSATGPYTGDINIIANDANISSVNNAQSLSGSSDAISFSQGLHTCSQDKEGNLTEAYNCVSSTFAPPKNIAASMYTGGHGRALRRFSENVSSANYAYIIFQPINENDICPINSDVLNAYIERTLPRSITTNGDKIILSNTKKSIDQSYPNIKKQMSSGVFITQWHGDGFTFRFKG